MRNKVLFDVKTENGQRGLGDILISTPIVQALKEKYGYLDYLVRKAAHILLEGNPHIDNVVATANPQDYDLHLVLGKRLEDYSIERNRQPRVDSMAELFGVKLKERLPRIYLSKEAPLDLHHDKLNIGISIESTARNRRWPLEYVKGLADITDYHYHLFGIERFSESRLIDRTDLGLEKTVLAVNQMDLVITVDSFYSHLAAALDIPSIILYTTIDADWRARYYDKCYPIQAPINCAPCADHQDHECPDRSNPPCVRSIKVEMVAKALKEILRHCLK